LAAAKIGGGEVVVVQVLCVTNPLGDQRRTQVAGLRLLALIRRSYWPWNSLLPDLRTAIMWKPDVPTSALVPDVTVWISSILA
jgi:hypothetical protein